MLHLKSKVQHFTVIITIVTPHLLRGLFVLF